MPVRKRVYLVKQLKIAWKLNGSSVSLIVKWGRGQNGVTVMSIQSQKLGLALLLCGISIMGQVVQH
jgi:hypothetical protein